MKVFLDTSAFAKRYVAEQGSDQVLAVCQQADSLVVSVICLPELISTLSRLVREKKLASAAYRKLKGDMIADLADVDICQITREVLVSVVSLLELHPLRAMDGLHVACALACAPDAFVSADHRQLPAARKAGLSVIDVS
ncbi:MAG: type II toxin-antitoxin system VapC family toxin [Candidatus Accumulibacter sp.]|uniref:Type II toxin-antitoxin system VapC family toxin n=1 Tax=Candidatus Accumulibacter affinis TaxID=2954384 RepID=A0A935TES1_9PROT|nr:type II toxin-antitoxin system VapC family toxin [Candidatus Accumulibacter affinis]